MLENLKKIDTKGLLIAVLLPLAVGSLASLITADSMAQFSMLRKPPLAPPGWLFPVVWTILYILMGISSYLITHSDSQVDKTNALTLYTLQLGANFLWSILFFGMGWYFFSFLWLCLLWILILATILSFQKISPRAAWLLVPYLLWVTFAGYLNLGIALLNKF